MTKVTELSNQNQKLRADFQELEQYSRKDNIIINGIPSSEEENVQKLVFKIAEKVGVTLKDYDISAAHRLPANRGKIPAIIVRLNSRDEKSMIISQSRKLKLNGNDLGLKPAVPIYINEHLTPFKMSLFKEALGLKKQGKIQHVWVKDCKIFIRKEENEAAIRIEEFEDINFPELEKPEQNETVQTDQASSVTLRSREKPMTLSQLGAKQSSSRGNRSKSQSRRK